MRIHRKSAQSATSIDRSPQDDETARMKQYVLTMAIRTVCIILAFAIQPFGWHTALFSVGAIVLPYIAVILANQSNAHQQTSAERPTIAVETGTGAPASDPENPVIRLRDTHSPTNKERDAE